MVNITQLGLHCVCSPVHLVQVLVDTSLFQIRLCGLVGVDHELSFSPITIRCWFDEEVLDVDDPNTRSIPDDLVFVDILHANFFGVDGHMILHTVFN